MANLWTTISCAGRCTTEAHTNYFTGELLTLKWCFQRLKESSHSHQWLSHQCHIWKLHILRNASGMLNEYYTKLIMAHLKGKECLVTIQQLKWYFSWILMNKTLPPNFTGAFCYIFTCTVPHWSSNSKLFSNSHLCCLYLK